ncbi:peptide-methionine (S)-S-oxide reductase MsrA [Mycolicibacterium stellerae]|uniref:peptide-methionine (S)-S-oxide reductase MsrA n=1 Tax=Mycolicibacterium stellerae TaxID=2358193 RepID=UPI000F0B5F82|nr:peptide-methionine (S)-S-oxide reductase MsrA [Mycolicibacterium stellerae]
MPHRSRTQFTLATVLGLVGIAAVALLDVHPAGAAESFAVPAPAVDEQAPAAGTETAVLAGGCFWGVQGVFQHVRGVTQAESGYAGGAAETAHYETVGTGSTGHAEAVRITYDPTQVTYGRLLQIYFSVVTDPTQLNRQGPDVGSQYRSAIFTQNADQQRVAQAYIAALSQAGVFPAPIVTRVEPNTGFFPAEGYHQNYLDLHPTSAYIAMNDMPKVADLARLFPLRYRDQPVLVSVA